MRGTIRKGKTRKKKGHRFIARTNLSRLFAICRDFFSSFLLYVYMLFGSINPFPSRFDRLAWIFLSDFSFVPRVGVKVVFFPPSFLSLQPSLLRGNATHRTTIWRVAKSRIQEIPQTVNNKCVHVHLSCNSTNGWH